MSQMSILERHARTATAMSFLNRLRHHMLGRAHRDAGEIDWDVLHDALEMSQATQLSSKAVRYSFRGLPDQGRAAALELSDAILAALATFREEDEGSERYEKALKTLIDTEGDVTQPDRLLVQEFAEVAMELIASESRTLNDVVGPKGI